MINQLVNQRYEVVEKIGDSPLFAVYRARDRSQNRMVAIKTVLAPYTDKQEFVEGLKSGLVASGNLKHPNIAQFYELGMEEGTPYAVLEYVRGINLKERIRRIAPFTLSVAVDYACALGEALNHAHSMGQAHGDLRPENIIISPEGAVKITDFGIQRGIARNAEAQQQVIQRAAPYHAPELSTTQPGTPAGDIYAMGSILYEMLTGTPLYAEGSPEAIADQHAFAAIPSPRAINQGVPRSIEGIIVKCLQKKPEQRYRNSLELLNDLKSVRDALRFGKPLSWSPIDIDNPETTAAPPKPMVSTSPPPASPRAMVPVAEVAASSVPAAMPTNNRLRAQDERVSTYIKVLIYIATSIIFVCLIGFVGIWMTKWVVPPPVSLPAMVGKPIEEVRAMAKNMHITLKEHGDYMDKPRNIVYRTDPGRGDQIRTNHTVNVWYSKGPTYVDVPNVVGLTREEAEKKLRAAGLTVGMVTPEFSEKTARGIVTGQDVSSKKRRLHDQPVGLTVSDGPKPEYAGGDEPNTPPPTPAQDNTGDNNRSPDEAGNDTPANDGSREETHTFNRIITINKDDLGTRQVRVEYSDAEGDHSPVIDEPHGEGDKIHLRFEYRGKKITLRVYYDDVIKLEMKDFDPQKQRTRKISGSGGNR